MTFTLLSQEASESMNLQEMKNNLENGDESLKVATMKQLLVSMANGEEGSSMLMSVIRFVLPVGKNKTLKKLMLLYFELCPKTDADGKLKQEMILVCNALRNDLQHPNEYVRGTTLRFLTKIQEQELMAPLVPSVLQCLEHKNAYVRNYALFTLRHIHRHFSHLAPNASQILSGFIQRETYCNCKESAFSVLTDIDIQAARIFFQSWIDELPSLDVQLQLAIVEFIHKDSKLNFTEKPRYIKSIITLMESKANRVRFSCASVLSTLSTSPSALKLVVQTFIEIAIKESDLNAKLVVIQKIGQINQANPGICNELAVEMLKIISTNELELKKSCVSIVLSLASSKHLEEIVSFLRKDLLKICKLSSEQHAKSDANEAYVEFLLDSLNHCLKSNCDFATKILPVFSELLQEGASSEAFGDAIFMKAILILRDVMVQESSFVQEILSLLGTVLPSLPPSVLKEAIWIMGEFSTTSDQIQQAHSKFRTLIGELPLAAAESKFLTLQARQEASIESDTGSESIGPKILADGSYATETAYSVSQSKRASSTSRKRPIFRQHLVDGHFEIGVSICNALAKLYSRISTSGLDAKGKIRGEFALMAVSIGRFVTSQYVCSEAAKIDAESYDRIVFDIQVLCDASGQQLIRKALNPKSIQIPCVVKSPLSLGCSFGSGPRSEAEVQADSPIAFRLLKSSSSAKRFDESEDEFESSLANALSLPSGKSLSSNLSKITQFTGYSDAVYAEAYVTVSQFDIEMDVLLVNQTKETIHNLTFELTTLGDLKLGHRPKPLNLAPYGFQTLKTTLKVSSTENAVIFGTIAYDRNGVSDGCIVALNDIKIDVADYIRPATCSQDEFNKMYLKFEWENKIALKGKASSLQAWLAFILEKTHFNCITPMENFDPESGYLSACLYAKSIFGEDVVANLSLEFQRVTLQVTGHLRLRAKATGIAYSLGEKIGTFENVCLEE